MYKLIQVSHIRLKEYKERQVTELFGCRASALNWKNGTEP